MEDVVVAEVERFQLLQILQSHGDPVEVVARQVEADEVIEAAEGVVVDQLDGVVLQRQRPQH